MDKNKTNQVTIADSKEIIDEFILGWIKPEYLANYYLVDLENLKIKPLSDVCMDEILGIIGKDKQKFNNHKVVLRLRNV